MVSYGCYGQFRLISNHRNDSLKPNRIFQFACELDFDLLMIPSQNHFSELLRTAIGVSDSDCLSSPIIPSKIRSF